LTVGCVIRDDTLLSDQHAVSGCSRCPTNKCWRIERRCLPANALPPLTKPTRAPWRHHWAGRHDTFIAA